MSTKYCSCHFIPRRGRSEGWIPTLLYALATSNFASNVSRLWDMIPAMKASMETYCTVKGGFGIPSFKLCPSGDERSKMSRHLPGWLFFGITPKRLICRDGNGGVGKGLATPFSLQIRINDWGVYGSGLHVRWSASECYCWCVKTSSKTVLNARKNIINCSSIRVIVQFQLKLVKAWQWELAHWGQRRKPTKIWGGNTGFRNWNETTHHDDLFVLSARF